MTVQEARLGCQARELDQLRGGGRDEMRLAFIIEFTLIAIALSLYINVFLDHLR